MGLFGVTISEAYGGMGADMVSIALVFEELSRGWIGIAGILGSHSLACWMIDRYGTDEQRARFLPSLATGERRTCIALTEPDTGSDLQGISTRAVRDCGDYLVSGTKFWITNARHAHLPPVLVKTDPRADPPHRGMSILLVDAGTTGLAIGRDIGKLGYKGPESCEVVLDDVRVRPIACWAASRAADSSRHCRRSRSGASTSQHARSGLRRRHTTSLPGTRPSDRPWIATEVRAAHSRSRSSKPSRSSSQTWPPKRRQLACSPGGSDGATPSPR
jgi:hypothetical protein